MTAEFLGIEFFHQSYNSDAALHKHWNFTLKAMNGESAFTFAEGM